VESFNGFMRRAVTGVFHSISVKHLGRYTGEATFRWNRKADSCLGAAGSSSHNRYARPHPMEPR
ncbi:transposase, partial [Acidocella sp.]|uniref:transposase n=1 Tax=Acidocella sp. TaxID=50710 RepID=UPI00262BFFE7